MNAVVLSGDSERVVRPSSSIYTGVSWFKSSRKWKAQIKHKGKTIDLGIYANETDAGWAVDNAWAKRGKPRKNAGLLAEANVADPGASVPPPQEDRPRAIKAQGRSLYTGVAWDMASGKWKAQIGHDGKQVHLGYYTDERDAARAADAGRTERGKPRKNSSRLAAAAAALASKASGAAAAAAAGAAAAAAAPPPPLPEEVPEAPSIPTESAASFGAAAAAAAAAAAPPSITAQPPHHPAGAAAAVVVGGKRRAEVLEVASIPTTGGWSAPPPAQRPRGDSGEDEWTGEDG